MKGLQGNFNAGILGPGLYSRGDLPKYQAAVKDAVNMTIRPEGGIFNRAGTRVITGYDENLEAPRLFPFDLSDDAKFMLEFTDSTVRFLFEQAYVLNSVVGTRSIVGLDTSGLPPKLVMSSPANAAAFTVGRLAYIRDPAGTTPLDRMTIRISAISGSNISFAVLYSGAPNTITDWGTLGAGATLAEVYEVSSPYYGGDVDKLVIAQDLASLYIAHPNYAPRTLTFAAADSWAFATIATTPSVPQPGSPTAVATTGSGSKTYRYRAAALDDETGEESLPSGVALCTNDLDAVAGNKNTFSWAAVTGASTYKVYKQFNGIYGYIGITQALSFVDENIVPDTVDNPKASRTPFAGAGNYPSFFGFIEQRLTAAASNNQPQGVEMSSSVSPLNFARSLTPGDSDAISFRPRAQKQSKIVAIVPHDEPVIFTRGSEGIVRGGDDKGYLTPTNLVLKNTTSRGSADFPKPLVIGETIMHVQRDGATIREYVPKRTDEESADLTLLARHLFRGRKITSWAYAQSPDSVVWVTTDRGELYSMTYLPEHSVWGWTRHVLGGNQPFVHQVEVLAQGADDRVYLVVRRNNSDIGLGQLRLVEVLDPRSFETVDDAYFVDQGLTFRFGISVSLDVSGYTKRIRGLLHLRKREVVVLADGDVIRGLTVDVNGVLTLDKEYDTVHVGLPYVAEFTTLGVNFNSPNEGDSTGTLKSTARVALQIENTRGIAIGREGGALEELQRDALVFDETPGALTTGTVSFAIDGDWVADARITVRQQYPLPMTVTGIAPDWELGG